MSVGLDKGVFIWDVRQDKPTRVVPNAHLHEITCCAINMRGGVVATGELGCSVLTPNERSAKPSSGSSHPQLCTPGASVGLSALCVSEGGVLCINILCYPSAVW